jgi:phage-related protein
VTEKPITWLGSSLADVRAFPETARRYVGHELGLIQQGLDPTDWKPMPTVGPGVREIRVHAGNEFRVIYVTQFAEVIYVLHAFAKKTRKTRQSDISLARRRLRAIGQRGHRGRP